MKGYFGLIIGLISAAKVYQESSPIPGYDIATGKSAAASDTFDCLMNGNVLCKEKIA